MTIVFFSMPAYGHLLSVLPVIEALAARHRVVTWSAAGFRELIVRTGSEFHEYPFDFSRFPLDRITADFLALFEALVTLNEELLGPVETMLASQRPDLVLHDSLAGFAKHACLKLGLRAACFTTTMAYSRAVVATSRLAVSSLGLALQRPLRLAAVSAHEHRYRARHGLRYPATIDLFANTEALTLVFTPEFFQPRRSTFGPSFAFVGPTIAGRLARPWGRLPEPSSDKPLAYVSLGTIFSSQKALLGALAREVAAAGYRVVVSGELKVPAGLEEHEFQVGTGWNQLAVLSQAALFVTHGGLNSVLEAMWFGVPQILVPQQDEQALTARRAARLGVGVVLGRFTRARLRRAIRQVAGGALRARLDAVRDSVRTSVKDAAALIEDYGRMSMV
jgi:MGT family glycosyltransferase